MCAGAIIAIRKGMQVSLNPPQPPSEGRWSVFIKFSLVIVSLYALVATSPLECFREQELTNTWLLDRVETEVVVNYQLLPGIETATSFADLSSDESELNFSEGRQDYVSVQVKGSGNQSVGVWITNELDAADASPALLLEVIDGNYAEQRLELGELGDFQLRLELLDGDSVEVQVTVGAIEYHWGECSSEYVLGVTNDAD